MLNRLFFGLLSFAFVIFSGEPPKKMQIDFALLRVINHTSQSYRISTIRALRPCKQKDEAFCTHHQKIHPFFIINPRDQKIPEYIIHLQHESRSAIGGYNKGGLLIENLMKPENYVVIFIDQTSNYFNRNANFSFMLMKPNKEKIISREQSFLLNDNNNFLASMDLVINTPNISEIALDFNYDLN